MFMYPAIASVLLNWSVQYVFGSAARTAICSLKRRTGSGVTFPRSLGTIRRSAPNAFIVRSFSRENASDERTTNG